MSDDGKIFNCHTHVFANLHVPDRVLPLKLVPWLRQPHNRVLAGHIARLITPAVNAYHRVFGVPAHNNRLMRLLALLEIAGLLTQQAVFETLLHQYPPGTRFVALAIDMDHMGAGRASKCFTQQLDELADLKQEYPDVLLPFIGIDPRQDHLPELLQKAHQKLGFCGIKLYPALGFFPDDPRLHPVYAYAQEANLPVHPLFRLWERLCATYPGASPE